MKSPPPFPNAGERYRDFREAVFRSDDTLLEVSAVEKARLHSIPELEIQARWFGGEFGRHFTSTDGEPVEIVQFGHWNHGAGPDFTETAVKIGDEVRRGAIEIDLNVDSWEGHGHGSNPEFNNVVLHIFLHGLREGEGRFFTRSEDHQSIPQVQIDLQQLADSKPVPLTIPEARLGRCATPLADMREDDVASLLVAAAQFRLQQKSQRLQKIAETHDSEQALFQSLAEALGFRHNKVPMAVLTQRFPLAMLKKESSSKREALLFGAAGFIDFEKLEETEDPDSKTYVKELWEEWWKMRSEFEPETDRELQWKLAATRPTNHPQRRLGALAGLLDSWTTFAKTALDFESDDWDVRSRKLLAAVDHSFWKTHYTLKSKPSAKPLVLIGKDRVRDILGNILFPMAVAASSEKSWKKYAELPAVDSNESLRRAMLRLFGNDLARRKRFSSKYFEQQALLQIYKDFCLEDASECANCPFPEQLAQWG